MKRTAYLLDSYFYLNIIQIVLKLWFSIKSEDWHSLAYKKFYIWVLSAHIFNVLLFKLFCVWYGKKADIKKKSTLQIGIFNAMKGKKNAKVHLIKIMKGPVKIFQDQGAAVSKVQFQRFFIFKEQIVSLNLS